MIDTVPTSVELMDPTLKAIHALGGSASIEEIVNQVMKQLALPPRIAQIPHGEGSTTELKYRLAWSRTYLKKSGFLDNSARGVWSLTASGRNTADIDSSEVWKTAVQQDRMERQLRSGDDSTGPHALNDQTAAQADSWREDLQSVLQHMPPDAFERLCQRLLRESGFIEVEVTGKAGDGGIDGHGIIRLAGLISFPVLFQCKRHSNSVGASVVRDFRGAMIGRADKGVILTTGTFTRDAQREATRDGAPPIDLIDGELLMERLRELSLGVSTRMVEVVEINKGFFSSI